MIDYRLVHLLEVWDDLSWWTRKRIMWLVTIGLLRYQWSQFQIWWFYRFD